MHRIQFNYSLKNIGLPSKDQYRRRLIEKVESVVQRMRWKAHFFLNENKPTISENKFGLPSRNYATPISEMKAFEEDLVKLTSNITFRKVDDSFLNKIHEDLKKVHSSKNVFVYADKSTNVYETSPDNYNKLLMENITKTYKLGNENVTDDINGELRNIASNLSIGNRVDTIAKRSAYITLKDHKENFESNPKFRLINPAKSELGKVSKIILDDINARISSTIKVNQWQNSHSVIDWFQSVNNKSNHMFLSFDIVEFYPSITEDLLDKAIAWAKTIIPIPDNYISIIKHALKSFLFNQETPWVKRNNDKMFDVTMGSFDGAEICNLVGLFILNKLAAKFGNESVGLYRDDGLALLKGRSAETTASMISRWSPVDCKAFSYETQGKIIRNALFWIRSKS